MTELKDFMHLCFLTKRETGLKNMIEILYISVPYNREKESYCAIYQGQHYFFECKVSYKEILDNVKRLCGGKPDDWV